MCCCQRIGFDAAKLQLLEFLKTLFLVVAVKTFRGKKLGTCAVADRDDSIEALRAAKDRV